MDGIQSGHSLQMNISHEELSVFELAHKVL